MTNVFVEMAVLFGRSVARRGALRTAQLGLLHSFTYARRAVLAAGRPSGALKNISHPFDQECGTDTGGLLEGPEVATGHPHDRYSVGYYAVAPSVFRETCRRWLQTLPASHSAADYTFVDIGAGKGRALLLASELPFREVIGIEFNEDLTRVARENAEKWDRAGRARCAIRVVHQEATQFRWPVTPLVVFLYNPFGHKVLRQLLAHLPVAAGPPVHILYVNPDCNFVLDRHPALSRLWSEHIPMSDADQAADFYSKDRELVSGYRSTQP
jgi:SAM-dependent methyltransferase